jgi:hypothetical protein
MTRTSPGIGNVKSVCGRFDQQVKRAPGYEDNVIRPGCLNPLVNSILFKLPRNKTRVSAGMGDVGTLHLPDRVMAENRRNSYANKNSFDQPSATVAISFWSFKIVSWGLFISRGRGDHEDEGCKD